MPIQIEHLLQQILQQLRIILKQEYTSQEQVEQSVARLLFKIEEIKESPHQILVSLVHNSTNISQLNLYLVQKIAGDRSRDQFWKEYHAALQKHVEPYPIQTQHLNKMIRDIFEGVKPLMEELKKLRQNLQTFSETSMISPFDIDTQCQNLSLSCLLRMAMQKTDLDFEKQHDQMLFRIYILWESLEILLRKAEYIFEELDKKISETPPFEKISVSNATKRSALSESIEIFKINQRKKQEEEINKLIKPKKQNSGRTKNIIPSDYKLVCSPKKEVKKEGKASVCCFP